MTKFLPKPMRTGLLSFVVAAAIPTVAPATIIFTNFGPSGAFDVTQGNAIGNDFAGDVAAEGDSFIPAANATLASVDLALSCVVGCPASDNFMVALRADNADSPGAAIETFSFAGVTLGPLGNANLPVVATSILKPTLVAGTRYWITVSASTAYAIAWNDNSTLDPSGQAVSSDGGSTWFAPSGMTPSAFEVDGTLAAPEPSTAGLLGGALVLGVCGSRLTLSRLRKSLKLKLTTAEPPPR